MATPTDDLYIRPTSGPVSGGRFTQAGAGAGASAAAAALAVGKVLAAAAAGTAGVIGQIAHGVPLAGVAAGLGAGSGNLQVSSGSGSITQFSLGYDQATPEQISIYCPITSAIGASGKVAVEYRQVGSGTWLAAHPLYRISPTILEPGAPVAPVDAFAGVIFGLTPGTTYDVRLTLTESGQPDKTLTGTRSTRALHGAAGAPNKTITPAGNLQTMLNGLVPGDVLQLGNGTYTVSSLTLDVAGTAGSPIYIRGESKEGVIIRDTTGIVLQLLDASHVVIENLTIEGSRSDSGTAASSRGIEFWNGATQTNITIRSTLIVGTDMGIVASGDTVGILVYNNWLEGNNAWTQANTGTPDVAGGPNLTWNDDGIRIPGKGNCAWNNTIYGYGDAFAVIDGVESNAVFFYRNKVEQTGDDACEGDYATRNCGFYDNYITNASTLLSLDPMWGGPFYCFRNIALNTVRGPLKFNSTLSGHLIYCNTVVHADGTVGWGWNQSNNGEHNRWAYCNNILIYRPADNGTTTLVIESTGHDTLDFSHNAVFPNGSHQWTNEGGSFASLAAALAGLPATAPLFGTATQRHFGDVVCSSNPFSESILIGKDHLVEVRTSQVPSIASGQAPKNAGRVIPGITDGYSGAAPDMGAIIEGRSVPVWGVNDFTVPYSVPSTVNTATQIAQGSTRDVLPAGSGHDTTSWDTTLFNAFGMGIEMPHLGPAGAYGWPMTGGHEDPSNIDLVYRDNRDGLVKRLANGHGLSPVRGAYGVSDTNGAPYFEPTAASPSTMPAPCHNYGTLIHVPRTPRGAAAYGTRGSTCAESQISRAGHIEPLGTRTWARAATGGASGSGNYEASAAYDEYTGDIYVMERYPGDYGDFVVRMRPDGNGGYTWQRVDYSGFAPQPGDDKGTCFILAEQRALLYHRTGALQCVDITSDATIANGPVVIGYSGTSPSSGCRWIRKRGTNLFYLKPGRSGSVLNVFNAGSNVKSGTGAFSTVTIGGTGLASSDGAHTNLHHTALAWDAYHRCLRWEANHNTTNLIKV